ncbi:MAG: TonB-dependent receptor [Rhodospirillaceae bacterium]|nr:TonB-dependent receptor [Rhodospirillaceae bacterium]
MTKTLRRSRSLLAMGLMASAAVPVAAQDSGLTREKAKPFYVDEIIVTATRNPQRLKTLGSAVDVLTSDDIGARPRFLIADLLRAIPGVAVSQSGPLGTLTQVRMRGAEGNHTLVLIDGMEVGDPFNNSEFDFSTVLADQVSRVEVLRGAQSSLYGSEAIGGVINITSTAAGETPAFTARAEGGAFGTWAGSARGIFTADDISGHASVSVLKRRGISQSKVGPERDGHRNASLLGGGKIALSDDSFVRVNLRYADARTELDTQDFTFGSPTQGLVIDSNDVRKSKTFSSKILGETSSGDGTWTNTLSWAMTDARGRNLLGQAFSSGSQGRKHDVEYLSTLKLRDVGSVAQSLSALLEYEHETFENRSAFPGPQNQRRKTESYAGAAEYRVSFAEQVFLTGALRHDSYELFQDATTFRLTGAWQAPASPVKLRASAGTGVAKPSFFELYGFNPTTFIGNPALVPEESTSWDAGVDLALAEARAVLSATYFKADLEDEIFTDFSRLPFTVRNRPGESRRQGVELSGRWSPAEALSLAASYTYTDAVEDTGRREVRRPKHIASLAATTAFLDDKAHVGLSLDYNGKQEDSEFIFSTPTDRVTLNSYVLATLSASYRMTSDVELTARVDNLFDENYEQLFSYNSTGIGAYVGVKMRLGE